jgi:hypothetical protein
MRFPRAKELGAADWPNGAPRVPAGRQTPRDKEAVAWDRRRAPPDYASSGSAAADPAVTAYLLAAGRPRVSAPEQRVALSQAPADPVQERDWRGGGGGGGGGVAGCGGGVAAGGGAHEAVVVGGSMEVGDVLFGDDEGELGMHGLISCWVAVRAL